MLIDSIEKTATTNTRKNRWALYYSEHFVAGSSPAETPKEKAADYSAASSSVD